MEPKKAPKENQLAKECIFTALLMLMEKKDFKDITISEIAKKAGVSRMTYYRTYSSKEDILVQYFEDKVRLMVTMIQNPSEMTGYQFCCHFFTFFKEHSHIIDSLYKADLLKMVINKFTGILESVFVHLKQFPAMEKNYRYQIALKAGALLSMLLCWIESGQKESPEELARMAAPLLDATA